MQMLNLRNSLIIEATEEPDFFAFFSPTLPGFSGVGHSVEDCLYRGRFAMIEHVALMKSMKMKAPPPDANPTVLIQNHGNKKRQAAA